MGTRAGSSEVPGVDESLVDVARALRIEAATRALAHDLSSAGIAVLRLKGPGLQLRLYGTAAAYRSGDVDLLIHKKDAGAACRLLRRTGWRFGVENGALWRLSRAATFARDGVTVDLHWGLHAAHLPAWTFGTLERRLWADAEDAGTGLLEPEPHVLVVYLALHAAGHAFSREWWTRNVTAAAIGVRDWGRVERIAAECGLSKALHRAMDVAAGGDPSAPSEALLDGAKGRAIWWATKLLRGHIRPDELRERLSWGVRHWLRPPTYHHFADLWIRVPAGVFAPRDLSAQLVDAGSEIARRRAPAWILDLGTGSGAIALGVAARVPTAQVLGIDVSRRAIRSAKANARRLGITNARFVNGSLLEPVPDRWIGRITAILANLPYVPPGSEPISPPGTTQGVGPDYLDLLRRTAIEALGVLEPGGLLGLQMLRAQWPGFADELRVLGYQPEQALQGTGAGIVARAWAPGRGSVSTRRGLVGDAG
jgi:methylase of polypeptide subunit release factors